jgi:hypothetical protein
VKIVKVKFLLIFIANRSLRRLVYQSSNACRERFA